MSGVYTDIIIIITTTTTTTLQGLGQRPVPVWTVFKMKERLKAKWKNLLTALTNTPTQLNSKQHRAR
jgi:hypothetical protein